MTANKITIVLLVLSVALTATVAFGVFAPEPTLEKLGIINKKINSQIATVDGKTTTKPSDAGYCTGKTPCYGKSDLAAHSKYGSCWGYNVDMMFDMTGYTLNYATGSEPASTLCGNDVSTVLYGSTDINGTPNNKPTSESESSYSDMMAFKIGYYDPSKQ